MANYMAVTEMIFLGSFPCKSTLQSGRQCTDVQLKQRKTSAAGNVVLQAPDEAACPKGAVARSVYPRVPCLKAGQLTLLLKVWKTLLILLSCYIFFLTFF